jgi:hypothetical protein
LEPSIPEGVIVEGDMLGLITTLNYADHDIIEEKNCHELVPNKFLRKSISYETHMIVIEPQVWVTRLQKEGILNLFDIPNFGWSQEINACVNMLPICVHKGYMWLDIPISIDIDLIVCITGLPSQREDPCLLFFDKKNEKTVAERMKEKFHTFCG